MGSGGKRLGSGRPKMSGKYKEPTKAIRLPEKDIEKVLSYVEHSCFELPLYSSLVSAGFPSPADDFIEEKLNLNDLLIAHPASTFFLKVSGDSMIGAGIYDGDLLIVDRSLTAKNGKIVIAAVGGELTVKRLKIERNKIELQAENPKYPPIEVHRSEELIIWGVVTSVIHKV